MGAASASFGAGNGSLETASGLSRRVSTSIATMATAPSVASAIHQGAPALGLESGALGLGPAVCGL
jgi:hypothetical protein